jgi:hypothetical protein
VNYALWFADMAYVHVDPGLLDLKPAVGTDAVTIVPGKKAPVPLVLTYADLDGTRRQLDWNDPGAGPAPTYFSFGSSDNAVATVDATGTVVGVATGQAVVEARLGGAALPRDLTVNVVASLPAAPAAPPPAPTLPAADVKSIYSDTYTAVANGIVFGTDFGNNTGVKMTEIPFGANKVQQYTKLNYAGIDLKTKVDVSSMTHLHADVWTTNATKFGIKLHSEPASGPIVERTVSVNGRTTYGGTIPAFSQGAWYSFEIPLAMYAGLPLDTVTLLVLLDNAAIPYGGDEAGTIYLDNVYFHR